MLLFFTILFIFLLKDIYFEKFSRSRDPDIVISKVIGPASCKKNYRAIKCKNLGLIKKRKRKSFFFFILSNK
jgi:hypothetical protein